MFPSAIRKVGQAAVLLLPLVSSFQSLPFAGLILFFGLSFFTSNLGLSRFVRFNIQQALILDIVLIFPDFFTFITKNLPVELQMLGSSTVFLFLVGSLGYFLRML